MSQLYAAMFYHPKVSAMFSDEAILAHMLKVEAALALAEAEVGVIPVEAAQVIASVAQQPVSDVFDLDALAVAASLAGNIAIPMVKQLTAAVQKVDATAAGYVHWGATSQDIIDTAQILMAKAAFQQIEALAVACHDAAIDLMQQHRHQVMMGRTWLQQALPISFGHKAARWASALQRDLQRLEQMKPRALTLQFGGAVGSLASLQQQGSAVVIALAQQLDLAVPDCTWHAERDRVVEIAHVLAALVGTCGKMARDWSLLMQTEIAEVNEPTADGRGGSSTMPHKRNPVAAAYVLAAANRVPALMSSVYQSMIQEHERALGAWHAEWLAIPELFQLCAAVLARSQEVLAGLEVNAEQMQVNIESTQGLVMAEAVMMQLADHIGRQNAHHLVQQACQQALAQQRHLKAVLAEDAQIQQHLSKQALDQAFSADTYLGNSHAQMDAVLKHAQQLKKMRDSSIKQ